MEKHTENKLEIRCNINAIIDCGNITLPFSKNVGNSVMKFDTDPEYKIRCC